MTVNRFTLDNGLRVVHEENPGSQLVIVNTLYQVGSRNEEPDHTGFAHLFEHLMFGGSANIPDFDKHIQLACGDNNAFTIFDFTNYYDLVPAANVETCLWLESDRMRSLAFTPESMEVQRQVVMEEFKQNYINRPFGDLTHLMSALAYQVHPYRWPTIGLKLEHIADATLDYVRDFFFHYYAPNNAILVIVGNITLERTKELVEKYYGDIPCRNIRPLSIGKEPPHPQQRRLTVEREVPLDLLNITFSIPPIQHPDFHACDMITDILAVGKSSRLYKRLVLDKPVFSSIDAYISGRMDPGLLNIMGVPVPGVSIQQAENELWTVLEQLRNVAVSEEELDKVKNNYEFNHAWKLTSDMKRAQEYAQHEMMGDATKVFLQPGEYKAVDAEQLQQACRRYLDANNANVLQYLSRK